MYEYVFYFVIYAFLGWCTEVAYKAVTVGQFVNRGFLNGPVCPIYGFGMVFVIWALTPVTDNAFFLFVGGFVITTLLEGVTGFVLEKLFHAKWWDYSSEPFNIGGYVCLKFSMLWALACMLIMNVVHPMIAAVVALVPRLVGKIVLAVSILFLGIDTVITVNTVMKLNKQLEKLTELGAAMRSVADEIGENIFEGVSDINERSERVKALIEEQKERAEEIKETVRERIEKQQEEAERRFEELREVKEETRAEIKARIEKRSEEMTAEIFAKLEAAGKMSKEYEKLEEERHFGYRRLMKAFPDMKHSRDRKSLEKIKSHFNE